MKKYRFALIGCGRISAKHVDALINISDRASLTAICDKAIGLAESKKQDYINAGGAMGINVYTDYRELLEKEEFDVAVITTISGKHAEISLDCLNRAKHVIVEKPMALSIKDADEMIATAERNHVELCVCHQNRFSRSVRALRNAIDEGRFGRIFNGTARILWNRDNDYYRQAPWRGTWEMDGGTLMNQCIHDIDLLLWSMGDEVDTVFSMCNNFNHDIETEDYGSLLLRFKNGSIGIIEGTVCVYPRNLEETLSIFGDKGTVCLGGSGVNKIESWKFDDGIDDETEVIFRHEHSSDNIYEIGHTALFLNFLDAIDNKAELLINGREGKKPVEVILAAYKSQLTGQPVKLPLVDFSTTDMKGMVYEKR